MGIVRIPDEGKTIEGFAEVRAFLEARGIFHDQWKPSAPLPSDADQETILKAYEADLKPFMERGGYQVADVISVFPDTEGLPAIRQKFLAEHTHDEDEVRYFIEGQGLFWFHLEGGPVFSMLCQAGDLISVPAHTRHWFDLGGRPHVRAIRIFIDPAGWVPHYTESGIDAKYNPEYA